MLCGIITDVITDGDLRRNLAGAESLQGIHARNIMNGAPISVQENISAEEARLLMKEEGIHTLVVKDRDQQVIGLLTVDNV